MNPLPEDDWYYAIGNEHVGPFSRKQLERLVMSGTLRPDVSICAVGLSTWLPADQVFGRLTDAVTPDQGFPAGDARAAVVESQGTPQSAWTPATISAHKKRWMERAMVVAGLLVLVTVPMMDMEGPGFVAAFLALSALAWTLVLGWPRLALLMNMHAPGLMPAIRALSALARPLLPSGRHVVATRFILIVTGAMAATCLLLLLNENVMDNLESQTGSLADGTLPAMMALVGATWLFALVFRGPDPAGASRSLDVARRGQRSEATGRSRMSWLARMSFALAGLVLAIALLLTVTSVTLVNNMTGATADVWSVGWPWSGAALQTAPNVWAALRFAYGLMLAYVILAIGMRSVRPWRSFPTLSQLDRTSRGLLTAAALSLWLSLAVTVYTGVDGGLDMFTMEQTEFTRAMGIKFVWSRDALWAIEGHTERGPDEYSVPLGPRVSLGAALAALLAALALVRTGPRSVASIGESDTLTPAVNDAALDRSAIAPAWEVPALTDWERRHMAESAPRTVRRKIRLYALLSAATLTAAGLCWVAFVLLRPSPASERYVGRLLDAVEGYAPDYEASAVRLAAAAAGINPFMDWAALGDAFPDRRRDAITHVLSLRSAYSQYQQRVDDAAGAGAAEAHHNLDYAEGRYREATEGLELRSFVILERFDTHSDGRGLYRAADPGQWSSVVLIANDDDVAAERPGDAVRLYGRSVGARDYSITNSGLADRSVSIPTFVVDGRPEDVAPQLEDLAYGMGTLRDQVSTIDGLQSRIRTEARRLLAEAAREPASELRQIRGLR